MPHTTNPADNQLHVFKTFMGMPPDSDTPPVCGKTLSRDYNGREKPHCVECDRILAEHQAHTRDIMTMDQREREDLFFEWLGMRQTLLREPLSDDASRELRAYAEATAIQLKRILYYRERIVSLGW